MSNVVFYECVQKFNLFSVFLKFIQEMIFPLQENQQILLWDIIIIMLYEVMLIFLLALAMCYAFSAKCSQQLRADY